MSYVYHALYCYFDRDNVALPGLAAFFKAASDEEREHAEILMAYQNRRGGRVKLQAIMMPEMEFGHAEKARALVGPREGGGTAGAGAAAALLRRRRCCGSGGAAGGGIGAALGLPPRRRCRELLRP